ncbi:MAG: DUF952 domain-containing protein [Anaerolineae bacterium]
MTHLLHITTREAWQIARTEGVYRGNTLESDGFIHCSLPEQVVAVANALYRGREDLVLLVIEAARVEAEIRYEDCYATGQAFPHVYGPLNLDAVSDVVAFPPHADGTFALPKPLRSVEASPPSRSASP